MRNSGYKKVDVKYINSSVSFSKLEDEVLNITVSKLDLFYGSVQSLFGVDMSIPEKKVTAFIGPSGCGKSSLLRCFNRMNDLIDNCSIKGQIRVNDVDIYHKSTNLSDLRRNIGMVFQKPNPFPKSIYENVAYGLRIQGINNKKILDERVEEALRSAAIWDEAKDRLKENAMSMSGGQQQRLVLARTLAVKPQILLLDEPASALDPLSTLKIEELLHTLKNSLTIIIVTHNMQQAARVSDYTAFMYMGKIVEMDNTGVIFTNPSQRKTEDYITGRYG